jgi:hypothetical protein
MAVQTIVISSGHGKYIRGASGYLDEVDCARAVVNRVAEMWNAGGVEAIVYHDNISDDQSENLNRIVNFHNSKTRDIDISVHFNAYTTTSSPMGTEVWYTSIQSTAQKVSNAMSYAGEFINRNAKYTSSLFFLSNTEMPALLLEVCFVDSQADAELYHENFEAICRAIAECVEGFSVDEEPPFTPPERPDNPYDVPLDNRPMLGKGDSGPDVDDLQTLLNWENNAGLATDSDFGNATEGAVYSYQASRGLMYDGIAGPQVWEALYRHTQPIPPPPHALSEKQIDAVCNIANSSAIARYSFKDRGVAPVGYMQGMALSYATAYRKLLRGDPNVAEMAKARTASGYDIFNMYRREFDLLGMSNEADALPADRLRHLFALLIGHGMRESSGKHCCGRDQSATNTDSNTCEAGLFQTSYNAHTFSDPEFNNVMAEYSQTSNQATCYLSEFDDGVSCSQDDWQSWGSGQGYQFQELCKKCPPFAVETCALTSRNRADHYGPYQRHESELRADADEMLSEVQEYVDEEVETAA